MIASTDGDTRVASNWLAETWDAVDRGADAVGGDIRTDRAGRRALDPHARRSYLRDVRYRRLVDELASRLDPDPADPWPRHHHHTGASLAVTAEAYRRVGGLPPLPSSRGPRPGRGPPPGRPAGSATPRGSASSPRHAGSAGPAAGWPTPCRAGRAPPRTPGRATRRSEARHAAQLRGSGSPPRPARPPAISPGCGRLLDADSRSLLEAAGLRGRLAPGSDAGVAAWRPDRFGRPGSSFSNRSSR